MPPDIFNLNKASNRFGDLFDRMVGAERKKSKGRKVTLADAIGVIGGYSPFFDDDNRTNVGFLRPDSEIKEYINIYKKDARVRAAIDLTSHYAVGRGWKFYSEDEELVKRAEALRKKINLDEWMERALKVMLITGDCYTEIRKKNGNRGDASLFILPSEQIETNIDKHGNLKKDAYYQIVSSTEKIAFPYEKILHMYRPFSSEPEGISILAAAKYPIECLWSLEKLMLTITEKYAAPLLVAKMGSEDIIPDQESLNEMRKAMEKLNIDRNRQWAVPAIIDFEQIESSRAAYNVSPYLNYFERQVYAALNVPPVLMGNPEGSNRTTAQVMMDSFERYVNALQGVLADAIKTLLRRFGFGQVPDVIFEEISPEDEAARVLRTQRMLGSDRSRQWITRDEARQMTPEVSGTWKEALDNRSYKPEDEKVEPNEPEAPDESNRPGERSGQRPASDRGTEAAEKIRRIDEFDRD